MSTPSPLIERMTADMEAAMTRRPGRAPSRLRRAGALIALAAVAAIAVVVVAGAREREREAEPAGRPQARSDPSALSRFDALLEAADPVPEDSAAARELRSSAARSGQDLARYELRQATFPDGAVIALGIGDRALCLRSETESSRGSMSCGAPASPGRLVMMYGWTKGGYEVVGALQNGMSNLRLHLRDGAAVPITPRQGFFHLEVGTAFESLTYRRPDGSTGRETLD